MRYPPRSERVRVDADQFRAWAAEHRPGRDGQGRDPDKALRPRVRDRRL